MTATIRPLVAPDGNPGLPRAARAALLLMAGVALIAGLTSALLLLGIGIPDGSARLASGHGPLMTMGFLGTRIALERAVALGRPWAYAAPLAAGVGGLAVVGGVSVAVAAVPLAIGAAVLLWIYAAVARVHASLHGSVQAVGAMCWLVAAIVLRLGQPAASAVPWLAAFLVLTVVGERLELSALVRPSAAARRAFIVVAAVFGLGILATLPAPDAGFRVAGLGLIGIAAWGARYDLARRTIRARGVTRFIAACLLAGYAWLAIGGAAWALACGAPTSAGYDASLHAVFLGFVISMVFGHAPVILPGVLRIPLAYHPAFYGHLVLLHAGLLVRVAAGDLLRIDGAWQLGGILNVAAVLLFITMSAGAAVRGVTARRAARRAARRSRPPAGSRPA